MQPTTPPTITSRLEILGGLAHAHELSTFGCHNSSVAMLFDYLEAALGSQQRWRLLLSEHNLLVPAVSSDGQRTAADWTGARV